MLEVLESSKGFSPKLDSESPVIQTIKKQEPVVEEVTLKTLVEEVAAEEPVVEEVTDETIKAQETKEDTK